MARVTTQTLPPSRDAKPAAETVRTSSRAVLQDQPTHQHPPMRGAAAPTTRDRLAEQFGQNIPPGAMPPTTRDRMMLGRAIEEKRAAQPDTANRDALEAEREQVKREPDSQAGAPSEGGAPSGLRGGEATPAQMPRPPPTLAGEEQTTPPAPAVEQPLPETARAPEAAPEEPGLATRPPQENERKADASVEDLTRATEHAPGDAEESRKPADQGTPVQAGEPAAPIPPPQTNTTARRTRQREGKGARAPPEGAAPDGAPAGARRGGAAETGGGVGAAVPGVGVVGPAGLALPGGEAPATTLETRAAAVTPALNISPDILPRISSFQTFLADQKSSIVDEVRAAQDVVNGAGDGAKAFTGDLIGGLQNGIELLFGKRSANVAARRQSAEASISTGVDAKNGQVEDERGARSSELSGTFDAAAQQIESSGTAGGQSIRDEGESQAAQGTVNAESEASRATATADTEAARYAGEASGDASRETRARGEEMASGLREQGELVSSTARDRSAGMAEDLEGATADAASQVAANFPLADLSLTSLASAAFSGLGQLLTQALAAAGRIYDAIAEQFAAARDSLLAELDNLQARFEALVDEATGNCTAALDIAGGERMTAVEETEAHVLDEAAEIPLDIDGQLDAALTEVEGSVGEGVADSNAEIAGGAARMSLDMDAGADSVAGGAGSMAMTGQAAADELELQGGNGFENLESLTDVQGNDFLEQCQKGLKDAFDCVVNHMAPVVADVLEAVASAITWVGDQIGSFVGKSGEEQKNSHESFATKLRDQYWDYVEEGGLVGALVAIGLTIVALLEYFVGVIWGIIKAILSFIVGLIALIVGIIAILFLFGVFLGILLGALIDCVGLIPAIIITIIVAVVGIVLLALALVVGIIIGIVVVVISIFTNIWSALTDPALSPFERGELIGQAIFDIVLLLLPFLKGKIKIGLPAALVEWLAELGESGRALARILRLLGRDAGLIFRLLEAVGGDLRLLEELLVEVRSGSLLLELLRAENMTLPLLRDLLRLFGGDAAELGAFLRLVGRDAALLRTLLGLAGEDVGVLRGLLRACADDATMLRRIFTLCGDDLALVRDLLRQTGNDGALLLELLEAVNGNAGRLQTLLGLADNPRQLANFLRGVAEADQAELERLLVLMRDFRIPLGDVEFLMRTRGMSSLDALRFIEGLMTERGRVTAGTASEARSILQALREGVIADLPRRPGPGEAAGDVDFGVGGGRGGPPPTFIDIKTPISPRLRPVNLQAADIAQGVIDRLRAADTRVIVDLRNLAQGDKALFLGLLRNEVAARGGDMDALIAAGRLVILNPPL